MHHHHGETGSLAAKKSRDITKRDGVGARADLRMHGYQYLDEDILEAENVTNEGVAILGSLSPNVIAMAGSDIRLSCYVQNGQNKTVGFFDNDLPYEN